MEAFELRKLKDLEEENRRPKHMYAELARDLKLAKEIIKKKLLCLSNWVFLRLSYGSQS